ncbi:MAG: type II toxin-antitoxin system VapC family toxin [Candidatus Heimdallarchaeota archaeon]|nr:type II toxin-antitoxin system VapC family toxin [Candidatus Heimdallarchaeota archaeon]
MILFDTSVLVEILRKNPNVISKIDKLENIPLFTTEISVMELVYGITSNKHYLNKSSDQKNRIDSIINLMSKFSVLQFDRKAAIKTAEIMGRLKLEGNMIDFRDGMIIGIGVSNGINSIYTLNRDHFDRVSEVSVY